MAHSPDSDDAFMFYALATRKIDTGGVNYVHLLSDIETLNRKALNGDEVSAISFHAYAYLSENCADACGASMKELRPHRDFRKALSPKSWLGKRWHPGELTAPHCALQPK